MVELAPVCSVPLWACVGCLAFPCSVRGLFESALSGLRGLFESACGPVGLLSRVVPCGLRSTWFLTCLSVHAGLGSGAAGAGGAGAGMFCPFVGLRGLFGLPLLL